MLRKLDKTRWKARSIWAAATLTGAALLASRAPSVVRRYWKTLGEREAKKANRRLEIPIPPLLHAKREKEIERLIQASSTSEEPGNISPKTLESYAREMLPAFDPALYFRVALPLAELLSRLMYRINPGEGDVDLHTHDADSVVVVMSHRTNLDYVVLAHLFDGRAVLSFAAGEWASGPVLGPLVRGLGTYFVRRDSGDSTYRRVLERFIQTAVESRLTQAIFLEGGLTRTGLLRAPKIGLLDYMLRHFDPDNSPDIVFVPVAAGYDRILEDISLIQLRKQGGGRPKRGWLSQAFASFALGNIRLYARGGRSQLGRAVVEVGSPVSFREYAAVRGLDLRVLEREDRIQEVSRFAEEMMRRISAVSPILPVPLLSHVLLESDEELSRKALESEVEILIQSLLQREARLPVVEAAQVVEEGLRMLLLRGLVVVRGGAYCITPEQGEVLRYYANALVAVMEPERVSS